MTEDPIDETAEEMLETLKGKEIRSVHTYQDIVLVKDNGDIVHRGEVIDTLDAEEDKDTIKSLVKDLFEDEFGPGASVENMAQEAMEVL